MAKVGESKTIESQSTLTYDNWPETYIDQLNDGEQTGVWIATHKLHANGSASSW
jgi:hypothetical protein